MQSRSAAAGEEKRRAEEELSAAFELALRSALPAAAQRPPSLVVHTGTPTSTQSADNLPAHRPVRLRPALLYGPSAFRPLPSRSSTGISAVHLQAWVRADAEVVPGGAWRSSTPSALFAAPRALLAHHRWTAARELMCSMCFLSEYMQTFGLDQLLDVFDIARVAAHVSANSEETAATFEAWKRFAERLRGCSMAARLSFLIQVAQQEDVAPSILAAAHTLVDSMRACISLTEERLMRSPPKKERGNLTSGRFESHSSVDSREGELASAVKMLQAFHALGGSGSLSRPWRARLFACCDAMHSGECKCCGDARTSLATCCEHIGQRLDQDPSTFYASQRAEQQAHHQQLLVGVAVGATGTQRELLDCVIELMRERRSHTVRLLGGTGCGISTLLALCASSLEDLYATGGGRMVHLCKMPWHSEQMFLRLLLREVVQDDGAQTDRISLHEALRQLDASQRLVLVLDGLLPEEQESISAAIVYSGAECVVSLLMGCSGPRSEEDSTEHLFAVQPLSKSEQHAILEARAAELDLTLTPEEIEIISGKEGAGSPQYLVVALRYIKLRRDAGHAMPWLDQLPGRTTDILGADGGVLAFLEHVHSTKVVKFLLACLVHFPAFCRVDFERLSSLQGIKFKPDSFCSAIMLMKVFGVVHEFSLPPMGDELFYAVQSKEIRLAISRRYDLSEEHGLEVAQTCLVALSHICHETDSKKLRLLLEPLGLLPDSARVSHVRGVLDAEDMIPNEADFSAMLDLERKCGELTGSMALQNARKAIDIRRQLPSISDLGALAELLAGYKINASCKEIEDARRILAVHEQLASEVEYSAILDLLSTLQGFSGSAILNRTKYQMECIRKIESERDVESLDVLLDKVAHIKGHVGLDRMRHVRMLERQLPSQKSIPKLSEMLEQCSVLTKTTSMVAAEGILYAENALRKGETDFDTIVKHLKVCDGMVGSPALERARRALAAEEALQSCASNTSSHHVKELLRDCEFVNGSQVINQAKRKARLHQELQGWVPFCLIRSLAQKIGQGFDTGAEQGAQNSTGIHTKSCKQQVQDLFAEFDTDKSGYIDREEMQTAFDRMGVRLTEREVDNLMSMADEDGTGEIDVLEFSDLIDSMLAKLNSIHSEDKEIQKIAGIMEELEGVHEASSHADDAQAIHEARFKIQMHSLEKVTHADAIRNFFSEYQDMLTSYAFLPEHVIERQRWIDSEDRIRSLLKSKSIGTPVVIAKRELWEAVQNCGALSGSLVLTRARRILDAENNLLFETNVHQLITLLKICGVLHGSPAVLNAKRLVSAEAALAALMDGLACCTMQEIQSAVNVCDNLQGSVVIDKAKAVILCEAVLEIETRSPIIRGILALCECVRDSRIIDRCRSTIATEWSIAVHESSSELTSLDYPIEFMMTEVMRQSLEVARAESLKLLRALASNVQVPVLRLSYEIVNVDVLWEVMQKCDGITESLVLEHAAQILHALDALPWTLDLEGMNMIKRAIIKEMGGQYMERHRMQAKLLRIFESMDGDGSGILSKHELDKAFFELGVNLLPADIDFLFQKYDTDNSGAVNFEEFENMTYDLLRGTKWTNSTNSSDIRQHLQVCGHMRSGILSDRVTTTAAWIAAEDQLIEGIFSHELLIDTVGRCGALTGSDILEKSVAILRAADEIKYATHAADIQALINVCGHLDGPEHMIERKRWLVAEERLYTLNYDKPFTEWLPCPYADLCDMVEQCGGLEESTALVNATKVLKAEAQLSLVKDAQTLRSLLKVCGHLTGSTSIASRRKALQAYSSLLGTRDVVRLQQLLKDCSLFEPCYLTRSIEELLNRDAQMKDCFFEEDLRVGISILSARISGSKNLSVALKRYGKFQRYRQAITNLEVYTDATILISSFRTFALRFLFDELDFKKTCCISFQQIAQALVALKIEPNVDAKRVTHQLFPSAVSDQLIVFVHLAFDVEVQKQADFKLDSEAISNAIYELGLVNSASLIESVFKLCSDGGPDELIYFEAFDDFISDQLNRTGQTLQLVKNLIPEETAFPQLEIKFDWLSSEERLASNNDFKLLQRVVEQCGDLSGSKKLDDARACLAATDALTRERRRENIIELLAVCGHLTNCASIDSAKRLLVLDDRLEKVNNLAQLKYLVHACRDLESDSLQEYKQVLRLHDKFLRDLSDFAINMSTPQQAASFHTDDVVFAFSEKNIEESRPMILARMYNGLGSWISTITRQQENSNTHQYLVSTNVDAGQKAKVSQKTEVSAQNMKESLIKILVGLPAVCPAQITFLANMCLQRITKWDGSTWIAPSKVHSQDPTARVLEQSPETEYGERHHSAAITIQRRARKTQLGRRTISNGLAFELGACDPSALISELESLRYELCCFFRDVCGDKNTQQDDRVVWRSSFDESHLLTFWRTQLKGFLEGYECEPDHRVLAMCTKWFADSGCWAELIDIVCNFYYLNARIENEGVNALLQEMLQLEQQASASLQCSTEILLKLHAYIWLLQTNEKLIAEGKNSLLYLCIHSMTSSETLDRSASSFASGEHVFVPTPRGMEAKVLDLQENFQTEEYRDTSRHGGSPSHHPLDSGLHREDSTESLSSRGSKISTHSKASRASKISISSSFASRGTMRSANTMRTANTKHSSGLFSRRGGGTGVLRGSLIPNSRQNDDDKRSQSSKAPSSTFERRRSGRGNSSLKQADNTETFHDDFDDAGSWVDSELEEEDANPDSGLKRLSKFLFLLRGDALAVRNQASKILESIVSLEAKFSMHGSRADQTFIVDAAAIYSQLGFLKSATRIGLQEILTNRIEKLNLENILDKRWTGLIRIKEFREKMQAESLLPGCLETLVQNDRIKGNPWRPSRSFLAFEDVMGGVTSGDSTRAVLSFNMVARERMDKYREKTDTLLLASLARISGHPRSLMSILSSTSAQLTVELSGAGPLKSTVRKIREQAKDAKSELRSLCPMLLGNRQAERQLRSVRLGIFAPDGGDSAVHAQEFDLIQTFVLPAIRDLCVRESIKVHFEWDVLSEGELVSQMRLFTPSNRDTDAAIVTSPPVSDGVWPKNKCMPYLLMLAGHVLDGSNTVFHQHGRDSPTVESPLGVRSRKDKLKAAQAKPGSLIISHKISSTPPDQRQPKRFIREIFLLSSEANHTQVLQKVADNNTVTSHGAQVKQPQSQMKLKVDRQGSQRTLLGTSSNSFLKRMGSKSILSRTSSTESLHDEAGDYDWAPQAVEWNLPPSAKSMISPDAKQYFKGQYYPTNWERAEQLIVEKHVVGQEHETLYRLADFGHQVFNSITSVLMDRYPAIEHTKSFHEQEIFSQEVHHQQLLVGVAVGATGTQRELLDCVIELMRERRSHTVRLLGGTGCGISTLLALCASSLEDLYATGGGRMVHLCKMPWHSEQMFLRLLLREVVQDDGAQTDRISLHEALRQLDASQRLVLVLDGLLPEEQESISAAIVYSGAECVVSLLMGCSGPRSEEDSTEHLFAVQPLSKSEQHAILEARAAELDLTLTPEEIEIISGKEGAGSPQYLVVALRYIKLRRDAGHAMPWLDQLPGRTTDILGADGGVLAFLEGMYGREVIRSLFHWLLLIPTGLSLTELQSMILKRPADEIACWRGVFDLRLHLAASSKSLSGLMRDLEGWLVEQSSYNGIRQALYLISSPVIKFAVAKRYRLYGLDNPCRIDVAIEAEELCSITFDTSTLRNYVHISSRFDAVKEKLKVISWLEAERSLASELDFNQLSGLVSSCGRLKQSSRLEITLEAFDVIAKLPSEFDVEKMRELLSRYKIAARHTTVDESRRILRKVHRMRTERNFSELKVLYASTRRFVGSVTIEWVAKMLQAEKELTDARTCSKLKSCVEICAGLLDCHNLDKAIEKLSAIEHIRLKSHVLKQDLDALLPFMDKHNKAVVERLLVEEGKGKMKVKKMTWQVDSKKLVAAVNAGSCESLVVDDAMMHMLDPGPLYMHWWDTFDEAVASLHTARSKAAMVLDSNFQFHVGEDVYSELQIQLPIVEQITDVEEIVSCLQAMEALRALDAGAVRSLMRINELMAVCGHIKGYKTIEQMREVLAAHDNLDSERDIRTLKKFLARCQWIEDSEVIERAKKNVGYITEIEVQYGLTSGGKKALPGPVLLDFVLRCHIYTGSEAVDMAIKLAQALAQLELEGDPMTWTNLLATCAEQAEFRPFTQPNEWDVGQVSHLLGICGHVIEEPVVVRSKQWYSGVATLTQACKPKILCGSRQLGIFVQACGRLHGKLTINRVINNMIDAHNPPLADALKDQLRMYLRECSNPKSELKFPGWTDLITMVDSCSGFANCAVPREDVAFFTQAISLLRARNALDALEELQGSSWPRDVQRLRRQSADCEGIAQIPALDTFRSILSDIDKLATTGHAPSVMKVVQSTSELTGCPLLKRARAQSDAIICLEQERRKDKIHALLATCEGLQGSDHLDRARKWILSEARLEGPLSAQEYGLVTLERNFVEMQRLVLACGDMEGSLALDAGREILAACARLATTGNAAELSSLVENIRSHNIKCCAELDEAQIVLDEEAKLAEIVNIPDLALAVTHVETFLHNSLSVQSANDRIMQALATSWRELLTNTSQIILTKLLHLGRDLVHSEMSSSVDSIDDCRQALSDLEVKLQAIGSLETEFRYPQTLDLLDIIGNIEGSTFLARARTWKQAVECLVNEDDASAIRHLVSQCQELSGSEVLDKARRQVETLDTIEALPDLHAVDPQYDLHYHVTQLSHYCNVCQNVKGHQKLTAMHDGNNAVNEVENFASLDTIEGFPKYWHEVAGADIASTVNNIWVMVESLPKQSDMSILKTLLLTLDNLNTTQPMLDDLYSSRTSSVPKTPGFTLVSTEPWHVTISNQAHELKRIVDKTFFVAGNTRIVRARTVIDFFSVEDVEFCPEIQRMPELHFKLRSGEVGQQMIGMILVTQAALKSGPYDNITKAVAAEAELFAEMRFPKIVKMLQACHHSMPLIWTESRARARKLIECEKFLAEESNKRFNGSVYDDLQSAVRGMEGIRDCAPLDAARCKLKLIEDIEKNHDYLFIRDVVPHVDMIQGSTIVDHAKRALQAVREMISTKNVARLRAIAAALDRTPRVTGIPDFQRVKDLLALEAKLDDFFRDADVQMALWKIGDRLDGSAAIIKARARLSKIQDMCETKHVHDLFSAASLGDIVLIKHYLEAGGTVHDKNSQGETALMHACTRGRMDAIEFLLASGSRLSDTAANGYNSLHYAVCAGHLSVVQLIVPMMKELRIPINAVVSALKSSPMHLAAKHGQSEIAYFLIENKASPEDGDANGNSALLCALSANKPDTAAFLIECGCNVKAQNADHYTALHLAAKHGHVHLVKDCMAAGLDPNLRTRAGLTALHLAAMESHLDMCFWLIHRPTVDINVRDNRGFTPLHHAASAGQVELVKLLLSYGANPHLQNYVARGYHALDVAKDPETIEVLSKYMTIPVTKTRLLHEAKLHAIVIYGCEELCDHCLRHGERKDAVQ